ncbi:hypothetical protein DRO19_00810 [Candidatus Bathyarchaeota archaeon]|nr:MAG: hypothetical protein DRO19_00810 [Candidatus Bathyarchaeota archaeon]
MGRLSKMRGQFFFREAPLFKAILETLNCINSYVTFEFSSEALSVRQLDSTRVAMVDYVIPKVCFEDWIPPETPKEFELDVQRMLTAFPKVSRDTSLHVELGFESGQAIISFIDAGKIKRRIFPMKTAVEKLEVSPPTIEDSAKCRVWLKPFIEDLQELKKIFGESTATLHSDKIGKKLILEGKEEASIFINEYKLNEGILLQLEGQAKSKYNIAQLNAYAFPQSILHLSEVANIEFGNDTPLKVAFTPKDMPLADAQFIHYLACVA